MAGVTIARLTTRNMITTYTVIDNTGVRNPTVTAEGDGWWYWNSLLLHGVAVDGVVVVVVVVLCVVPIEAAAPFILL